MTDFKPRPFKPFDVAKLPPRSGDTFGDWIVDNYGLRNKLHHYRIDADRLGEQRMGTKGVSDWALHMLEKKWVDADQFIPALKRAIERHAPNAGIDWAATMKAVEAEGCAEDQ